jgi:type I restriction enzyme S subunit
LDAGVASLKRVQTSLKRYRASVLKVACEGRLVPTEAELARKENRSYETGEELLQRILKHRREKWNGKGKYEEPNAPDLSLLPPPPEGWAWANIQQLIAAPLCNGISVKGSDKLPGVRALRLSAMSESGFDFSDCRYLPLNRADVDDLWIREGDFFVSRGNGSLHLVGRGTSAQAPREPTIFPDTMIRLRLASIVRASQWVRTLWPSRLIRTQIEAKVKTTAGIYKIAQPQVGEITLPLPPLAEQRRIVASVERRLSVIEELGTTTSKELQRTRRLRQSILQQAFSGRLATAVGPGNL